MTRSDPPLALNTRRLQARSRFEWRTLRDVWRYRELLFFFVWRDVKVRYTQTTLGIAWALVQPVVTMGVFSVFFGRLAGMPSDGVPYPLFSLCALVPWSRAAASRSRRSSTSSPRCTFRVS
jgi:lipopolysaccharide transport system permease protein